MTEQQHLRNTLRHEYENFGPYNWIALTEHHFSIGLVSATFDRKRTETVGDEILKLMTIHKIQFLTPDKILRSTFFVSSIDVLFPFSP